LDVAAAALSGGDLVVLPTEAVYGLGCDAYSPRGEQRLLRARGGDPQRPAPILLPRPSLAREIADLDGVARDLVDAFWPGGLTLVCRARPGAPGAVGNVRATVSLRVPLQPVALELLDGAGPMAVTGATAEGRAAATDCDTAREIFGDQVAVYLDVGTLAAAEVSTVVDVTGDPVRVLRRGAVPVADLTRVAGTDRIELVTAEATGR
jgi:tRNA threonylcarbamoyl adenosine modification protein (Sua5/YciO/YrdC/YwlC family)